MRVVSLFDGCAMGYEALKRAGIKVDEYVAYEIEKNAIKIALKNHPDIKEMGSVVGADFTQFKGFDLVIGGFCCNSFSVAGKERGFNDPRGQLFYDFSRAIKEVQPKYFLGENVTMKKEFEDVITNELGVEPTMINSSLVSAQNRKRLYWTNIPNIPQPEDKGIMLKDIVHEYETEFSGDLEPYKIPIDKAIMIMEKEVQKGKIEHLGNKTWRIHDKEVVLDGQSKDDYLFGCITPERVNKRQNGQRFNDGDKFYTLTAIDRHGILINGYIRKLTAVENERLQTLPEGYTECEGVSENARCKCCGLGWTVDVISHILKNIK